MIYDGVNCEHVLHWTLYSKAREFPKEKSSIKEIKDMIIRWTPLMLLRKTVLIHFLFYLPGMNIIFYIPHRIFNIHLSLLFKKSTLSIEIKHCYHIYSFPQYLLTLSLIEQIIYFSWYLIIIWQKEYFRK